MRYTNKFIKLQLICAFIMLVFSKAYAQSESFTVIQLSDPQFGFIDNSKSFEKETELYTKAIEKVNELKPDFIVITGDLVNNQKDTSQINEFKRITALIDSDIPFYLSPGNHDLGQEPTDDDFKFYYGNYGKKSERFSFHHKNSSFIGFNSVIIKSGVNEKAERKQFLWLKKQLKRSKKSDHIFLFTHYPFFLKDIDEPEEYMNQTKAIREKYFELFDKFNVKAVFAGHLHNNAEAQNNDVQMITTNSTGMALGNAKPGLRIIEIGKNTFTHSYQEFD